MAAEAAVVCALGDVRPPITLHRRLIEDEDSAVDPYLFDDDYTVACSTGFQVWEGSFCLVDAMRKGQLDIPKGARVLELGAGAGLAGLAAAAMGANVLLTDVKPVVDGSLKPNIERNGAAGIKGLPAAAFQGAVPVGDGSAAAQPLNWSKELACQCLPNDPTERIDVILAAECVWLSDILDEFLDTLKALLTANPAASVYLSFRERAVASSQAFVSSARLWSSCAERGLAHAVVFEGDAPEVRGKVCEVHRVYLT